MSKKLTTEEYIEAARAAHGDRYDYSLTEYNGNNKKIVIICQTHGAFSQIARDHKQGKGCAKCGRASAAKKTVNTLDKIITDFRNAHGDKYDYSLVERKNSKEKVKIICPKHGLFEQIIGDHKVGKGCFDCGKKSITKKKTKSASDVLADFITVHGNTYDYDMTTYIGTHSKMDMFCKAHGVFRQTPASHKRGRGCPECAVEKKILSNKAIIDGFKKAHGNRYDYSLVGHTKSKDKIKIICREHGTFYQKRNNHQQGQGCPRCQSSFSSIEETIKNFLTDNSIEFEAGNRIIVRPKELDIFLPKYNVAIECNGLYWHSARAGRDRSYHLDKTIACQEKGIRLLHFWDFEINDKFDIVKSIILNAIGKTPNRLYARKLTLDDDISTKEASVFCERNHIHGFRGGVEKVGLRNDGKLVSLMITGSDGEMVRFVSKINTNVVGGFSRLLKRSSVKYSFVDRRLFDGSGYLRNGFEIRSKTSPNYFYEKDGIYAGSRQQFQKHKLKDKLVNFDNNMTEIENMNNNGFYQVFDCGNYKMIKKRITLTQFKT